MKKLLAILTGAAMLLCSVPLTASAEDVNTVPRRFIVMKKAHCVTCDVLTLRCVNDPYIVPERFTGDAAAYMGTFLLEEGKDPLVNAIIAEAEYGDVIEYTGSSMTWELGTMYNEMHRETVDGKYPEDGEWKYREGERFDIIGTVAGTDYIAEPYDDGFEEPARQPEIIITDAEGAMYRVVREDSVDIRFQVELVEDLPMYQDKLADPEQKIMPSLRENMPWKGSSQPVIITPRTYSAGYIEKTAAVLSTTADGDPWLAALDSLYTTTGTAIMDKLMLDYNRREYTSAYTPMILCNLTAEQIEQAAQMDEVACLSLAKNSDLVYYQTMFVVAAKDDEQAHLFEISQERSRTDVSDASTYAHMTFRLNDWMSGGFFTEQCKDLEVGDIVLYNGIFYYNDDSDECLFLTPSPGNKFRKLGNTADCPALTDAVQPTYANCYKLVGDENAIRAELLRLYGEAYPIPYGDVNTDGTVNASDAAVILYNAALMGAYGGNTYLDFASEASADVNGDGICNASDAADVLLYAAEAGAGNSDAQLSHFTAAALTPEQYSVLKTDRGINTDHNKKGCVILTNSTEELIHAIRETEGTRAYVQESDYEQYAAEYEDHCILLVYSTAGAGSRYFQLSQITAEQNALRVFATCTDTSCPTPDMCCIVSLVSVKRSALGDCQPETCKTAYVETRRIVDQMN